MNHRNHPNSLSPFRITMVLFFILSSPIGADNSMSFPQEKPAHTNHLIHETSPYLLQHAHNPVDWHPWGKEALERAKNEDKPIFLSIGYAACHWCHVMEKESFENQSIAKILNENFIPIKVDREERPDLDEIYMTATQLLTGSGGWPMSVWLTPDLQPFYAGTYYPPEDRWGRPGFGRVLTSLAEAFHQNRDKIERSAREITHSITHALTVSGASDTLDPALVAETIDMMTGRFDPRFGGFGGAPKFPHSMDLMLLLREFRRSHSQELLHQITFSLDRMACGGMYDQIAGGFHRYSVDDRWLIPHFEKMLYDNALLARTYLEAFQVTSEKRYAQTGREILDYVIREMQSPEGGYYSSTDADSEGEEGRYFVWSQEEILSVLGKDTGTIVCEYYDVQPGGNFEHSGKSVLSVPRDPVEVARQLSLDPEQLETLIREAKTTLRQAREKRVPPALDDKILTDWNGLMISAMAFGGFVLAEPRYIESASKAAASLITHQWDGRRLLHTRRGERSHLEGMLSDYANLVMGLIDLYQATLNPHWLEDAIRINQASIEKFYNPGDGGFFNTCASKDDLLLRSRSAQDGATPSGNSIAVHNLLRLGSLTGDVDLISMAEKTLLSHTAHLRGSGAAFPQMVLGLDLFLQGVHQIVFVLPDGTERNPFLERIKTQFLPNVVWLGDTAAERSLSSILEGKKTLENQPTAYVCQGERCLPPVTQAEDLMKNLSGL